MSKEHKGQLKELPVLNHKQLMQHWITAQWIKEVSMSHTDVNM